MRAMAAVLAILVTTATAAAPAVRLFDPTLDPAFQLARARSAAVRQQKQILLDVGGNWCASCLLLQQLFDHDPRVAKLLSANYVLVHINVSPDNLNSSFMARFPKPTGYPFLIVVDPRSGKVVHAQDGLALQGGTKDQGYVAAPVAQFLMRWATKRGEGVHG